jgi:hypothetical protein
MENLHELKVAINEIATHPTSDEHNPFVDKLVFCIDKIFSHGLKKNLFNRKDYWNLVASTSGISKNLIENVNNLEKNNSKGKGISFIKISLMEGRLGMFMDMIRQHEELLNYYENDAVIVNNYDIISDLLKSVESIDFNLCLKPNSPEGSKSHDHSFQSFDSLLLEQKNYLQTEYKCLIAKNEKLQSDILELNKEINDNKEEIRCLKTQALQIDVLNLKIKRMNEDMEEERSFYRDSKIKLERVYDELDKEKKENIRGNQMIETLKKQVEEATNSKTHQQQILKATQEHLVGAIKGKESVRADLDYLSSLVISRGMLPLIFPHNDT